MCIAAAPVPETPFCLMLVESRAERKPESALSLIRQMQIFQCPGTSMKAWKVTLIPRHIVSESFVLLL